MINSMWADIRDNAGIKLTCVSVDGHWFLMIIDIHMHQTHTKKSKPDQRKPQVNAVANTVFH